MPEDKVVISSLSSGVYHKQKVVKLLAGQTLYISECGSAKYWGCSSVPEEYCQKHGMRPCQKCYGTVGSRWDNQQELPNSA